MGDKMNIGMIILNVCIVICTIVCFAVRSESSEKKLNNLKDELRYREGLKDGKKCTNAEMYNLFKCSTIDGV